MQFALTMPPFGDYADPHKLAETARMAEAAGWDGFFIWDHVIYDPSFHPIPSTPVALAVIAMNTTRLRFGAMVSPLPRRRPWNAAREAITLDQLSNGRLILGAGIGGGEQWEFAFVGEETDARIRAEKLDESLDIITGLWRGEPFSYRGKHYHLAEMTFHPTPVQKPRIPIWIGGGWDKPKPLARAARYDGCFPLKWTEGPTPEDWHSIMDTVNRHRPDPNAPYDWVTHGSTPGDDPIRAAETVHPYAEMGVTWWMEDIHPWRFGFDWEQAWVPDMARHMDERIQQGPPRF